MGHILRLKSRREKTAPVATPIQIELSLFIFGVQQAYIPTVPENDLYQWAITLPNKSVVQLGALAEIRTQILLYEKLSC